MQELDKFTFVKMKNKRRFVFRNNDLLFLFREKRDVFFPQMPDKFREINRGDFQCFSVGLLEFFVLHNGARNFYQTVDFFVKQSIIFRSTFYDTVIHSFQITFDGGDRGFYLMTQIRKEIGTDFLLVT